MSIRYWRRFKLYTRTGKFIRYVNHTCAMNMLAEGSVDRVSDTKSLLVLMKFVEPNVSGGWPALRKLALDKHPSIVVGGMTRTEHKPRINFKESR